MFQGMQAAAAGTICCRHCITCGHDLLQGGDAGLAGMDWQQAKA
jgi:hypothetical protein